MPSIARSGVVGKYIELPPELVAEVERLAKVRGHKFREEVIDALRRHLAYPPPPPTPPAPLPDAVSEVSAKGGHGRSKKVGQKAKKPPK